MPTHYDTLGLPSTASTDQIRRAFRTLAVKYHPDKNPGDRLAEERFKRVNAAYQVLSDPQRKAQYDLKVQYQQARQNYQQYQRTHRPPPPRPANPFRSPSTARRTGFSPKEERKSTYFAFAFVFVVTVLIVIVVQVNKVYQAKILDQKRLRRSELLVRMQSFCEAGMVDSAMYVVRQLQQEGLELGDIESARQKVLGQLYLLAERSYSESNYEATVFYGSLVNERWDSRPPRDLNLWLARSHSALGDTTQALQRLDSLMAYYPADILPYMEAARMVFRDRPADGLGYYADAINLLVDGYEHRYGNAYMLVMPPSEVPGYHFEVFLEVGKAYLTAGQAENALGVFRWAIHLKRRNPEGYRWLVACYDALAEPDKACFNIRQAIRRGYLPRNSSLLSKCN